MAKDSKKRSRDESSQTKKSKKKVVETDNSEAIIKDSDLIQKDDNSDEPKPLDLFKISEKTKEALVKNGIETLFPIQWKLFEDVLKGKDVIGRARTGSGKTISYTLPLIERLIHNFDRKNIKKSKVSKPNASPNQPFALILAPTRELVRQVNDVIKMIGSPHGVSSVVIYGGASYETQEYALRRGVDVVVGTPGRLIDHLERGNINLDNIKCLILDEADEMLNIGFKDSIERILEFTPKDKSHQTLLYSATIPEWVRGVCKKYLDPDFKTVDLVENLHNKTSSTVRHFAVKIPNNVRASVISDLLQLYGNGGNAIIFCDTKMEANELGLSSHILQDCQVIHGDIVQSQRELTMDAFRAGNFKVLVATDVAARGLDIENIDLVIQIKPPTEVETFIHRSGRTGRAGKHGINCLLYQPRFIGRLRTIEREAGIKFERVSAPQPKDLFKSTGLNFADNVLDLIANHPNLVESFAEIADQLIQDTGDHKKAIAACIALGCGFKEPPKPRSLLAGTEDKSTVHIVMHDGEPFRTRSFAMRSIMKVLGKEDSDFKTLGIGEVRLCKDGSAVADVPHTMYDELLKVQRKWISFKPLEDLPEMEEEEEMDPRRMNGGRGGRGGYSRGGNNGYSRGGRGGYSRGGSNGYSRGGRGGSYRGRS